MSRTRRPLTCLALFLVLVFLATTLFGCGRPPRKSAKLAAPGVAEGIARLDDGIGWNAPERNLIYRSQLGESSGGGDDGIVDAGDDCPPPCGNGVLDAGEECDDPAFGGATCVTRGFAGGGLVCLPDCTIDDSNCYFCGDGIVDADLRGSLIARRVGVDLRVEEGRHSVQIKDPALDAQISFVGPGRPVALPDHDKVAVAVETYNG